jgi:hypothetical protein
VQREEHCHVRQITANADDREEKLVGGQREGRPVLVVRGEDAELADPRNQPVDELPVILGEVLPAGVPEQPDESDRQ